MLNGHGRNYLDGPGKDIQLRKKEEKQPNNNGYSLTILLDIYFMLQTLHQFI
jgi:hypothetical protein